VGEGRGRGGRGELNRGGRATEEEGNGDQEDRYVWYIYWYGMDRYDGI
jgi:hypothetical protein